MNTRGPESRQWRDLVAVMGGGMIGTDPDDPDAWSGSSRHFFGECRRQGLLRRAIGVEAGPAVRAALILRNFSPDGSRWRQKFHLDTRYYEALAGRIVETLSAEEREGDLLQIGGIYDVKRRLPPRARICSYHDGNLAQASRSPYFPAGVPGRTLQRALDYERSVCERLEHVFTMSAYLRRSFVEDLGVPPSRVTAIGAGVNLDAIPPVREKDYSARRMLFVGRDFERKGGRDVLRAFREVRRAHPDARLDIAGPQRLSIPGDLAAGVVDHGFLGRGAADRERLDRLYRDATLFVMPSLYEPFGIAAAEAMIHRLPCVLSDRWAFPEMVEPGVNGALVAPGDAPALAEAIIALLDEPSRLERMGDAARERALRDYTWPVVVSKLARALEGERAPALVP